jgi:hypothetical protein
MAFERSPFTEAEARALTEHEAVIGRGLETFMDVANALLAIEDNRLYRCHYETADAYCRDRWDLGRQWAYPPIATAQFRVELAERAPLLEPVRRDSQATADAWWEATS